MRTSIIKTCEFVQAHFDCVPPQYTVIDGARSRWCHLLLVNSIVGILDFDSFNLAARRKFNQQQVLCECIKAELQDEGIEDDDKEYNYIEGEFDRNWVDMKSLKVFLEQNAPYKSKDKYLGILDILLNHKVIISLGSDITKAINSAMRKILAPSNRKPGRRQVIPLPIKSKRVQSLQLAQPVAPVFPPMPSPASSNKKKRGRTVSSKMKDSAEEIAISPVVKKARRKPYVLHRVTAPSKPAGRQKLLDKMLHKPVSPSVIINSQDVVEDEEEVSHGNEEAHNSHRRAYSFDGEAVFNEEHDEGDIDPNAQPWELLDPMPSRESSPNNFRGRSPVGTFAQPSGYMPLSLNMVTPETSKMMVPFPECVGPSAVLHMNPFPLDDGLDGNSFYQRSPPASF